MAPGASHFASQLRLELSLRNRAYAKNFPHVESYGSVPVIVYPPSTDARRHGNFSIEAYEAICERPEWLRRFGKVHSQAARSLPKGEHAWKELDSSMSSDALLMNVFCYPGVTNSVQVSNMLGIECGSAQEFGFKARVPLKSGRFDRTEVDMKIDTLLVESKLTETSFQTKDVRVMERYRDFEKVFYRRSLPKISGAYTSYQLIRNVLAAYALECSFCVLHDSRRPDLREAWFSVMSAVRTAELKIRCKILTWQELCEVLPEPLQAFLDLKYGIVRPGCQATPIRELRA